MKQPQHIRKYQSGRRTIVNRGITNQSGRRTAASIINSNRREMRFLADENFRLKDKLENANTSERIRISNRLESIRRKVAEKNAQNDLLKARYNLWQI